MLVACTFKATITVRTVVVCSHKNNNNNIKYITGMYMTVIVKLISSQYCVEYIVISNIPSQGCLDESRFLNNITVAEAYTSDDKYTEYTYTACGVFFLSY